MTEDRENKRYLPDVPFPPNLKVYPDLSECLAGVRDILVAVPSHGLRDTLTKIKPMLRETRACVGQPRGLS